jgi:drug/metabolite transporter (DMT)-like permease
VGDPDRDRLRRLVRAAGNGAQARDAGGCAYGVWSAIGVAATVILGRYLFGDPFTAAMAGGVVLIAAGVCLLETGSIGHRSS